MFRYAYVLGNRDSLETVQRYLPSNYQAEQVLGTIYIYGQDSAGWTLDGYVIPRCSSGLIAVKELV